jgi:hypothetical protein
MAAYLKLIILNRNSEIILEGTAFGMACDACVRLNYCALG